MNKEIVEKIHNYVEQKFKSRASAQGILSPVKVAKLAMHEEEKEQRIAEFNAAQSHFFTGAMAALQAVFSYEKNPDADPDKEGSGDAMPPKWVFSLMRGDEIPES